MVVYIEVCVFLKQRVYSSQGALFFRSRPYPYWLHTQNLFIRFAVYCLSSLSCFFIVAVVSLSPFLSTSLKTPLAPRQVTIMWIKLQWSDEVTNRATNDQKRNALFFFAHGQNSYYYYCQFQDSLRRGTQWMLEEPDQLHPTICGASTSLL